MSKKQIYLHPEFWIGLLVLCGGIFQLFQQFEISLTTLSEQYWPLLFVITGIIQLSSDRYRDVGSNILLILVGATLLIYKGGFVSLATIEKIWPETFQKILNNLFNFVNFIST
jgi:hypothetical protein